MITNMVSCFQDVRNKKGTKNCLKEFLGFAFLMLQRSCPNCDLPALESKNH